MTSRLDQHKNEIIHSYTQDRLTGNDIAKRYNSSSSAVLARLRLWGIKPKSKCQIKSELIDNNRQFILDNYLSPKFPKTIKWIAHKIGVDESTLSNRLKKWGVRKRGNFKSTSFLLDKNKSKIIDLYTNTDKRTADIAKMFKVAECTIQQRLTKWGIPARIYKKAVPQEIKRLYDLGFSPEDIANKLDASVTSVYKILVRDFGIHHTKKRELTLNETRDIKYLYSTRGLSPKVIADLINKKITQKKNKISDTIIRRVIKELNLKKGNIDEISNEDLNVILGLFKDGLKISDISKKTHYPVGMISSVIDKYSLIKINKRRDIKNLEETVEKIREYRLRGLTLGQISGILNLSKSILYDIISEYKITSGGKVSKYSKEQLDILAERIKEMRTRSVSVESMSKQLNISTATINRVIKEYKIPFRKRVFTDEVRKQIEELASQQMNYKDIANKLGLLQESVRQETHRMGIQGVYSTLGTEYSDRALKLQNYYIKKYYLAPNYFSMIQISKTINIDKTTVKARLKAMGIPIRNSDQAIEARRNRTRMSINIPISIRKLMLEKKQHNKSIEITPTEEIIQEYKQPFMDPEVKVNNNLLCSKRYNKRPELDLLPDGRCIGRKYNLIPECAICKTKSSCLNEYRRNLKRLKDGQS